MFIDLISSTDIFRDEIRREDPSSVIEAHDANDNVNDIPEDSELQFPEFDNVDDAVLSSGTLMYIYPSNSSPFSYIFIC